MLTGDPVVERGAADGSSGAAGEDEGGRTGWVDEQEPARLAWIEDRFCTERSQVKWTPLTRTSITSGLSVTE
jgi:hypothetical protein